MLLRLVSAGLLATMAIMPVDSNPLHGVHDRGLDEIIHFRRDAVVEARDLELAERHQVNLTEMYKHSVIKRSDGDHITIWVDNGFIKYDDSEEPSLNKRMKANLYKAAHFTASGIRDFCRHHDRRDWTSGNSPTTGGIIALRQWCWNHSGYFGWGPDYGGDGWRSIIVAGSNGDGTNARYRAKVTSYDLGNYQTWIGTDDVASDADFTLSRARQFDGKWKAASYGWESCGLVGMGYGGRMNYEIGHTTDRAYEDIDI